LEGFELALAAIQSYFPSHGRQDRWAYLNDEKGSFLSLLLSKFLYLFILIAKGCC
jgi:hypothetical protein